MLHDFNTPLSIPQLLSIFNDHAGCDPDFDETYAELDREFQTLRLNFNE